MFTEQNITTFSFFNMTLIINTVYRNNDLRSYPSQRCNEFRLLIRACVYLLKVSIGKTKTMCEICAKLTIKTP